MIIYTLTLKSKIFLKNEKKIIKKVRKQNSKQQLQLQTANRLLVYNDYINITNNVNINLHLNLNSNN